MARPKLRRPDQPGSIQLLLSVYEFLSSLKLAVVLIFSAAFALGWATFVESSYGTPAVQFGVYGTWWFATLNALLAVNIFCAASIRFPWTRKQTGFVITHVGLLTLLFGCLISRRGGIDAQMPLLEGRSGQIAYEDAHHIRLDVERPTGKNETITIPVRTGPFNWQDYGGALRQPIHANSDDAGAVRAIRAAFARISGFLFQLPIRDQGVVYDRDGIRVELLDFYSDSMLLDVPYLKLQVSLPRIERPNAEGKFTAGPRQWVPLELRASDLAHHASRADLEPSRSLGAGKITFQLARSQAEQQAFMQSAPQGALGKKGQVVLWAGGRATRVNVAEKEGKGRFPVAGTQLEAEIVEYRQFSPEINVVRMAVFQGGKAVGTLALVADEPWMSSQDHNHQVYGTYWFDRGTKTTEERMAGRGGSRIDVLQGSDRKLYYRYWNGKQLVAARPLPMDGTAVDAFKMPIGQLQMKVAQFIPSPQPDTKTVPLDFQKDKAQKRVAARLHVAVDGESKTFWIGGVIPTPIDQRLSPDEQQTVTGEDRVASVTLRPNQVDVGFQIHLKDFERKLDPGTSQASHFTSIVDFADPKDEKPLESDVVITMNAPVDFSDKASGRSYRLFQESFNGPWRPGEEGEEIYYQFAGDTGRDEIYSSTLTVNYDPGRGVKYAGSLLIVAGIATMFYMRAYFFKPAASKPLPQRKRREVAEPVA